MKIKISLQQIFAVIMKVKELISKIKEVLKKK